MPYKQINLSTILWFTLALTPIFAIFLIGVNFKLIELTDISSIRYRALFILMIALAFTIGANYYRSVLRPLTSNEIAYTAIFYTVVLSTSELIQAFLNIRSGTYPIWTSITYEVEFLMVPLLFKFFIIAWLISLGAFVSKKLTKRQARKAASLTTPF